MGHSKIIKYMKKYDIITGEEITLEDIRKLTEGNEEVTAIDIDAILVGLNGIKYKINKFTDDATYVVLDRVDKIEGEHEALRVKIEELHNYTVEK